jgi:hypothetical protein
MLGKAQAKLHTRGMISSQPPRTDTQVISEEQFNRFSISSFDFEKALNFANEAKKYSVTDLAYEALLFTAIVCYCRPFSPNERARNAKAASKLSLQDFPALAHSERVLHDQCKSLRNEALAHSAWNRNPTRLNRATGVVSSKPFSLITPPFELDQFIEHVKTFHFACERIRGNYVIRERS